MLAKQMKIIDRGIKRCRVLSLACLRFDRIHCIYFGFLIDVVSKLALVV
jgi:hypothetical protein